MGMKENAEAAAKRARETAAKAKRNGGLAPDWDPRTHKEIGIKDTVRTLREVFGRKK